MGGKKLNSFTLSAHFSEQNNAYYVWQTSTQYFRTYGVAAGLGKRLNWPDPYFLHASTPKPATNATR